MCFENVTGSFGPAAKAGVVNARPARTPSAAPHPCPLRPCITPPGIWHDGRRPQPDTRPFSMARDGAPGQREGWWAGRPVRDSAFLAPRSFRDPEAELGNVAHDRGFGARHQSTALLIQFCRGLRANSLIEGGAGVERGVVCDRLHDCSLVVGRPERRGVGPIVGDAEFLQRRQEVRRRNRSKLRALALHQGKGGDDDEIWRRAGEAQEARVRHERLNHRLRADNRRAYLGVVAGKTIRAKPFLKWIPLIELREVRDWRHGDVGESLPHRPSRGEDPSPGNAGLLESRDRFVLDDVLPGQRHFRLHLGGLDLNARRWPRRLSTAARLRSGDSRSADGARESDSREPDRPRNRSAFSFHVALPRPLIDDALSVDWLRRRSEHLPCWAWWRARAKRRQTATWDDVGKVGQVRRVRQVTAGPLSPQPAPL